VLLIFFFQTKIAAQPLTTYTDMQNQLMVWDNGIERKIDFLPPTMIKTGRVAIPYLDNSRNFKIYYRGGATQINNGFTNDFYTSDNLIIFLNAQSLNVFDKGTITNLSKVCNEYYFGDSIVLFNDGVKNEFKAYYNGRIYPIENYLAAQGLDAIQVSDNVAAYNNYANQFRIFYHGNIIGQEEYLVNSFDVGRNTVAYVDANKEFKIFHAGKTFNAEKFAPTSYQAGDDLVAYVSNEGYLKVFYEDSIRNFGFMKADFLVGDNVIAFRDGNGFFKAFYKGDIIPLENYVPENYVVQYNSIAYVNRAGVLRLFSKGEIYDVTTLMNSTDQSGNPNWELTYDVLKYNVGLKMYHVFYNGNEY
jgi:hypothetical protein